MSERERKAVRATADEIEFSVRPTPKNSSRVSLDAGPAHAADEPPPAGPDIQEEDLALEYPAGREPMIERTLRRLPESLVWEDQRALTAELRAVAG